MSSCCMSSKCFSNVLFLPRRAWDSDSASSWRLFISSNTLPIMWFWLVQMSAMSLPLSTQCNETYRRIDNRYSQECVSMVRIPRQPISTPRITVYHPPRRTDNSSLLPSTHHGQRAIYGWYLLIHRFLYFFIEYFMLCCATENIHPFDFHTLLKFTLELRKILKQALLSTILWCKCGYSNRHITFIRSIHRATKLPVV